MKNIKCRSCNHMVPENETTCPECGNALKNKISKDMENLLYDKEEHKKRIDRYHLKNLVISFVFVLSILFGVMYLSTRDYRSDEELYAALKYEMKNYYVHDILNNSDDIDYYLKKLPKDYQDVSEIREEWKIIKRYVNDLDAVNKDTATNENADKAREAYVKLKTLDDENEDWDLRKCLSHQISSVLFGLKWEGTYWLMWHDVDGVRMFGDNFPNNKSSEKGYLFSMEDIGDSISIVYTNFKDSTDQLTTLVLSGIRYEDEYFYLTVRCTADDNSYTVRTAYSVE